MNQGNNDMGLREVTDTVSHVAGDATAASIATKYGMGGGAATSIFGWLTSNGSAVAIGILVTLAGFIVNYFFQRRRDKRENDQFKFQQNLLLAEEARKVELHKAQLNAILLACPTANNILPK